MAISVEQFATSSLAPVPRVEPLSGFQPWVDATYDRELYPALTIHQFGFYINAAAERQYDLAKYNYVRLYWDATTRRVSFKFYPKGGGPCVRRARLVARGRGRRVSCAPFWKACGITAEDYGKYHCTDDSGIGLLVIQLRKPTRNWAPHSQLEATPQPAPQEPPE